MGLIEELGALGVNTEEAIKRFVNNAALYERMVKKLPDSMDGKGVMDAIETGTVEEAINKAHTLKGVLGNLSITPLYEAYTEIVALLRNGEISKAKEVLEGSFPKEKEIIECIRKYC